MLRVMKFGGTSVGTAAAIGRTVEILVEGRDAGVAQVAVVSAMGGVTNLLLAEAESAAQGDRESATRLREGLRQRHFAAIDELVKSEETRQRSRAAIDDLSERCGRLLESVHVLRDLSTRSSDLIVSFGERMSSVIVAAALEQRGVRSANVDSDRVIVTDDSFGSANPLLEPTRAQAAKVLRPLLDDGVLPVVTGFFGASESGATTTLG
ncbi:MAG TPA: aspartate kinase, partial [Nitrolancea sp.]|nr:aspartate kinase [Nitrolancea sp.]